MDLTQKNCKEIINQVLAASSADETQVVLSATTESLTRFANNGIHQNVTDEDVDLTVRVVLGGKTARATTNRLDSEGLSQVVQRACRLAQHAPQQDMPKMPGPQRLPRLKRHHAKTAKRTPMKRAKGVEEVVRRVKAHSLNSAGYLSDQDSLTALADSIGLFAFDQHTQTEFSVTVMAPNSSGWAKAAAPSIDEISLDSMTDAAIEKALRGKDPITLEPGPYTVIMEPAALADLLGFLSGDFSGLSVDLKQSCLTDKLGTQVFGENISLIDDWSHALQMGLKFDGDGLARTPVRLVDHGVVQNLVYSLSTAHQLKKKPTGHGLFFEPDEFPMNLVMSGGEESLEQMIRSTKRGLFVTRFWYIREVDPTQKILTGMTRDGTFLIEDGEIRSGVKNMRFNQSLISMLNQVEAMGPSVRTAGEEYYGCLVVPAVKVRDFHFTGKTLF